MADTRLPKRLLFAQRDAPRPVGPPRPTLRRLFDADVKKLREHRGYRNTWFQESQERELWRVMVKHLLDEGKGAGAGVTVQSSAVENEYPAVRGTFAVAFGYLAHIGPLATLKWDPHTALIGLLFAIPIAVTDAIVMLPSWDPPRTTRKMKILVPKTMAAKLAERNGSIVPVTTTKPPASSTSSSSSSNGSSNGSANGVGTSAAGASAAAEGDCASLKRTGGGVATATALEEAPARNLLGDAASLDDEMVEMERTVMVRGDQHPLRDALNRSQKDRTVNNLGNMLSVQAEALLIVLVHVSEEMLYRGVLLTLAVRWTTDRLYEAGADDFMDLLGGLHVPTQQVGTTAAATVMTLTAVALLVQRELFPLRVLVAAKDKFGQQGGIKEIKMGDLKAGANAAAAGKKKDDAGSKAGKNESKVPPQSAQMAEVLERVRKSVVSQQRWSAGVTASQELVQWSSLSASYLLTGNILAPMVGSIVVDSVFSTWQRVKAKELMKARKEETQMMNAQFADTKALVDMISARKKERLQPPANGSTGSGSDEDDKSSEEDGSGGKK